MAKAKKLPPMKAILPADHPDVLAAKQAVMSRFPYCENAECGPCQRNRKAVEELIATVVANVLIAPEGGKPDAHTNA